MLRQLVAYVLRARPIPKHVAFIMDGNRRFAERQHLQKVQGHTLGYQRMISALEWCLDLGVQCVSVYAFSIDNYNRSPDEVDTLMRLAEEKLGHMLQVGSPDRSAGLKRSGSLTIALRRRRSKRCCGSMTFRCA